MQRKRLGPKTNLVGGNYQIAGDCICPDAPPGIGGRPPERADDAQSLRRAGPSF